MDNLWVLILLLVVGSTIVTVRLFRNGAREDAEAAAFESLAPAESPAGARRAASRTAAPARAGAAPAVGSAARDTEAAAAPARARSPRRGAASKAAAPPAAWPGGDCPKCGSPTVPSAKFCGECGHRLVP